MSIAQNMFTKLNNGYTRTGVFITMTMLSIDSALATAPPAPATPSDSLGGLDVNADKSGGKTVGNVLHNVNETAQQGGTLVVSLAALAGYIIIIISLFSLYKASKDEREKPTSSIVGLFMGGLLAGVGTVMYIIRNSVVGTGPVAP